MLPIKVEGQTIATEIKETSVCKKIPRYILCRKWSMGARFFFLEKPLLVSMIGFASFVAKNNCFWPCEYSIIARILNSTQILFRRGLFEFVIFFSCRFGKWLFGWGMILHVGVDWDATTTTIGGGGGGFDGGGIFETKHLRWRRRKSPVYPNTSHKSTMLGKEQIHLVHFADTNYSSGYYIMNNCGFFIAKSTLFL